MSKAEGGSQPPRRVRSRRSSLTGGRVRRDSIVESIIEARQKVNSAIKSKEIQLEENYKEILRLANRKFTDRQTLHPRNAREIQRIERICTETGIERVKLKASVNKRFINCLSSDRLDRIKEFYNECMHLDISLVDRLQVCSQAWQALIELFPQMSKILARLKRAYDIKVIETVKRVDHMSLNLLINSTNVSRSAWIIAMFKRMKLHTTLVDDNYKNIDSKNKTDKRISKNQTENEKKSADYKRFPPLSRPDISNETNSLLSELGINSLPTSLYKDFGQKATSNRPHVRVSVAPSTAGSPKPRTSNKATFLTDSEESSDAQRVSNLVIVSSNSKNDIQKLIDIVLHENTTVNFNDKFTSLAVIMHALVQMVSQRHSGWGSLLLHLWKFSLEFFKVVCNRRDSEVLSFSAREKKTIRDKEELEAKLADRISTGEALEEALNDKKTKYESLTEALGVLNANIEFQRMNVRVIQMDIKRRKQNYSKSRRKTLSLVSGKDYSPVGNLGFFEPISESAELGQETKDTEKPVRGISRTHSAEYDGITPNVSLGSLKRFHKRTSRCLPAKRASGNLLSSNELRRGSSRGSFKSQKSATRLSMNSASRKKDESVLRQAERNLDRISVLLNELENNIEEQLKKAFPKVRDACVQVDDRELVILKKKGGKKKWVKVTMSYLRSIQNFYNEQNERPDPAIQKPDIHVNQGTQSRRSEIHENKIDDTLNTQSSTSSSIVDKLSSQKCRELLLFWRLRKSNSREVEMNRYVPAPFIKIFKYLPGKYKPKPLRPKMIRKQISQIYTDRHNLTLFLNDQYGSVDREMYSDTIRKDIHANQTSKTSKNMYSRLNEGSSFREFVHEFFLVKYGSPQLAEKKLLDFLDASKRLANNCAWTLTFCRFLGFDIVKENSGGLSLTRSDELLGEQELIFYIQSYHTLLYHQEKGIFFEEKENGLLYAEEEKTLIALEKILGFCSQQGMPTLLAKLKNTVRDIRISNDKFFGYQKNKKEKIIGVFALDELLLATLDIWTTHMKPLVKLFRALFKAADFHDEKILSIKFFKGVLRAADPKLSKFMVSKLYAEACTRGDNSQIVQEDDFVFVALKNQLLTERKWEFGGLGLARIGKIDGLHTLDFGLKMFQNHDIVKERWKEESDLMKNAIDSLSSIANTLALKSQVKAYRERFTFVKSLLARCEEPLVTWMAMWLLRYELEKITRTQTQSNALGSVQFLMRWKMRMKALIISGEEDDEDNTEIGFLAKIRAKIKSRKRVLNPIFSACRWHRTEKLVKLLNGVKRDDTLDFDSDEVPEEIKESEHDNDWEVKPFPIDEPDDRLNTLLHIAVQNGHEDYVAMLIERGANVNAQNITGQTPMHFAKFYHLRRIFFLLRRAGANDQIKNVAGLTCQELDTSGHGGLSVRAKTTHRS